MNRIGVLINLKADTDLCAKLAEAKEMGIDSCQLSMWDTSLYTTECAEMIKRAVSESGVRVSALWAGWSGPSEWNFTYGPSTIGLVPAAYRGVRLKELLSASEFAEKIGVDYIVTHVGFLPNDPNDADYVGTVSALRYLTRELKKRGQTFLFETGQETPVTLLRAIEDIGADNVGINLDTANLILYGMANTLDAVRVFGKYVKNTHIKDGFYPTDGKKLGREVKSGEGLANIPAVVEALLTLGYDGPFTIEREISGEEQKKDVAATVELLNNTLKNYEKAN